MFKKKVANFFFLIKFKSPFCCKNFEINLTFMVAHKTIYVQNLLVLHIF